MPPATEPVFISYRRADSEHASARLHDLLQKHGVSAFRDRMDIQPGTTFPQRIRDAVEGCQVMLVVIGPKWLSSPDPEDPSRRRLDQRGDWVAREIGLAFRLGKAVTPVLVDEAGMPAAGELPSRLKALAVQQAVALHNDAFELCVADLVARLQLPGAGRATADTRQVRDERLIQLADRPRDLVGREELLTVVEGRFASDGPRPRHLYLHGLGGVGKTSLALEFAHRNLERYGVVWQFVAENATELSAGFGALANRIGMRDRSDSDPRTFVHTALAGRTDRWLLLLDNVPDPVALKDVVPTVGDGEVIVTSRYAQWPVSDALEVPPVGLDAAMSMLTAHASEVNEADARELAGELDGLPLALEQATAYMQSTGRTLTDYLRLFRANPVEMLRRGDPEADSSADRAVARTWDLAFRQIRTVEPAMTLSRLLAWWAPEAVPVRVLLPGGGQQVPLADSEIGRAVGALRSNDLLVDDAVVELRRFSLIGPVFQGRLSVHRLVQTMTRAKIDEGDRQAWRRAAADLVEAALPKDPKAKESWPLCATLLPHARATFEDRPDGMSKVIDYLDASGDYPTARDLQKELCDAAAAGADGPSVLPLREALARLTGLAGDPAAARDMLEALKPLVITTYADDPYRRLSFEAELADWTGQAGDWVRARAICCAALPAIRALRGDHDPKVLELWGELGFWTGQTGDSRGAVKLYAELLPIMTEVMGEDDRRVLERRSQYARWLGDAGDAKTARDMCVDLLPRHERAFGKKHPATLWMRSNLAAWTGEAGDPPGARDLFEDVVADWARLSGPEHPATLTTRANLQYWTGLAGDAVAARDMCAELLPIRERVNGRLHPETLLTLANLARWTAEAGEEEAARHLFRDFLVGASQAGTSLDGNRAVPSAKAWLDEHPEPPGTEVT